MYFSARWVPSPNDQLRGFGHFPEWALTYDFVIVHQLQREEPASQIQHFFVSHFGLSFEADWFLRRDMGEIFPQLFAHL